MAFHGRRVKLDFEKKQRLPEPRRSKKDEFEELTGGRELLQTYNDTLAESSKLLKEPSVKGFGGLRRSKEPYERQKEEEASEESLKPREYKAETKRRRFTRKRA